MKTLIKLEQLSALEKQLIAAAEKAVTKAYCPYSNFAVGAAVLTHDGKIFSGGNIENCSSGLTVCAERVAILKAVSEGYRDFLAIAIYAPGAPPKGRSCGCGACRQVLLEFGLDILVLKLCNDGMVVRKTVRQLMPNTFMPSTMGKKSANLRELSAAIVAGLTPALLKPKYRHLAAGKHKTFGHCYVATEALYHMLGGAVSGYVPQVIRHEGGTHWYLKHRLTGRILDLTRKQFATSVPYDRGRGAGFLTKEPSKRARAVIEVAVKKLSEPKKSSKKG